MEQVQRPGARQKFAPIQEHAGRVRLRSTLDCDGQQWPKEGADNKDVKTNVVESRRCPSDDICGHENVRDRRGLSGLKSTVRSNLGGFKANVRALSEW